MKTLMRYARRGKREKAKCKGGETKVYVRFISYQNPKKKKKKPKGIFQMNFQDKWHI